MSLATIMEEYISTSHTAYFGIHLLWIDGLHANIDALKLFQLCYNVTADANNVTFPFHARRTGEGNRSLLKYHPRH